MKLPEFSQITTAGMEIDDDGVVYFDSSRSMANGNCVKPGLPVEANGEQATPYFVPQGAPEALGALVLRPEIPVF